MSAKHTPGPWEADIRHDGTASPVAVEGVEAGVDGWGRMRVAEVRAPYRPAANGGIGLTANIEERDANALLVAAAPDMYAALKANAMWIHDSLCGPKPAPHHQNCTAASDAIAKAEGRS